MEGLFLCAATVIEIFSGAVREALLATRLSPEVEIHDDSVAWNALVKVHFLPRTTQQKMFKFVEGLAMSFRGRRALARQLLSFSW